MPWDIPWVSALSGPMEQLMVRNMARPSELQSDAELQTGGQLSVPFSRKGGAEQPEDRHMGLGSGPGQRAVKP